MSPLASQARSSPAQSVTTPPASVTRRAPAATSQAPEADLEEPVEHPGRRPGQVETGRAGPAEVLQGQEGTLEHPPVVVETVLDLEREAGGADGRPRRAVGDPQGMPVPEGPAAPHGGVGVPEHRGVDGARHRPAGLDQGHRHADHREAVEEVGRAVEGVDHPPEVGPEPAALLAEEGDAGGVALEGLPDGLLAAAGRPR